jgi:hypothetical protein
MGVQRQGQGLDAEPRHGSTDQLDERLEVGGLGQVERDLGGGVRCHAAGDQAVAAGGFGLVEDQEAAEIRGGKASHAGGSRQARGRHGRQ